MTPGHERGPLQWRGQGRGRRGPASRWPRPGGGRCVSEGHACRRACPSVLRVLCVRQWGVAGRPLFPPKPPGISCPSGCCSPAFSPRSPGGAGSRGLEGTRGWWCPGKGRSSSPDTVRPELGGGLIVTRSPKAAATCTRGLGPTEAHRLPVVLLGVRSPPRPQEPPGSVPALPLCPGRARCTAVGASSCVIASLLC